MIEHRQIHLNAKGARVINQNTRHERRRRANMRRDIALLIFFVSLMLLCLIAAQALAQVETVSRTAAPNFEVCKKETLRTASQFGGAYRLAVDTPDLFTIKIPSDDGGTVIVSCSRPDRVLLIQVSE